MGSNTDAEKMTKDKAVRSMTGSCREFVKYHDVRFAALSPSSSSMPILYLAGLMKRGIVD